MSYEEIYNRYMSNYITDAQLDRFVALGIITQEQADNLRTQKHPIG